jgi:hypothetical protein
MSLVQRAQRTCVTTYLVTIAIQFYAAGLAAFGVTTFMPHALLGYGLVIGAITLASLTAAARLPRRLVMRAAALVPLTILQPVLALVPRVDAPALSALHTVNALLIVLVAASVARESRPRD